LIVAWNTSHTLQAWEGLASYCMYRVGRRASERDIQENGSITRALDNKGRGSRNR
jgi:hypothetical protein